MNARYSLTSASAAHCGSLGSLPELAERMPTDLSKPAGVRTFAMDDDGNVRKCMGFQPMSKTLRTACAANLAVVASSSTSAPEDCNVTICESMVGSVTS